VNKNPSLLTLDETLKFVREQVDPAVEATHLLALQREGLLPAYREPENLYLPGDIQSLAPLLKAIVRGDATQYSENSLFSDGLPAQVRFGQNTWIPLGDAMANSENPAILPALRLISRVASDEKDLKRNLVRPQLLPWLGAACIRTTSETVLHVAKDQVAREARISDIGISDFAGTAYYMGTKRSLGSFLVEALASVLPPSGIVLDLMCGSGAASGAFCRVWQTFASDAQLFSQHLATVQGGGFTVARATSCLTRIMEEARNNEIPLQKLLGPLLRREAELSHSDLTEKLSDEFQTFLKEIPTFPGGQNSGDWDPTAEVKARLKNPSLRPFCLFTAYFAGLYFGVRQSVEIDSLRYGIEQLRNQEDRKWALGALIVAASVRGTTYAAHFAQPRSLSSLSVSGTGKILEGWAGSIYHEFAVRLNHLARQSESARYPVKTVPGPWQTGIEEFSQVAPKGPVVVYLDAPYTREEYSRYYHVLETLVQYRYPSAVGRGKVPTKESGERFASELFTRNRESMEDGLVNIIRTILAKGWTCAWSYSDSGQARITKIIERITAVAQCRCVSFAAPHRHAGHRGKPHKKVTEYLLLFVPKNNRQ
jgi:adenine-specific DNA-methyltransferase